MRLLTRSGSVISAGGRLRLVGVNVILSPTVVVNPATNIGVNSATLNGTVNPNGGATNAHFEWGTTLSYELTGTPVIIPINPGSNPIPINRALSNLSEGTLYHFRIVATNSAGTTNGSDATFTTDEIQAGETLIEQNVHPRLLLTPSNISQIATKLNSGTPLTHFQNFVSHYNTFVSLGAAFPITAYKQEYVVVNFAFLYQMRQRAELTAINWEGVTVSQYFNRALEILNSLMATRIANGEANDLRLINESIAYDWLFNGMTNAEREYVIGGFLSQGLGSLRGIFMTDYMTGEVCGPVVNGLSFKGDLGGAYDVNANSRLDRWGNFNGAQLINGGMITGANLFAPPHPMGYQYGVHEHSTVNQLWVAMECYRTSNTTQTKSQFYTETMRASMRGWSHWTHYMSLHKPLSGSYYQFKNMYAPSGENMQKVEARIMHFWPTFLHDLDADAASFAQWMYDNRVIAAQKFTGANGDMDQRLYVKAVAIMGQYGLTPKSPDTLAWPLSVYWPDNGMAIGRTSHVNENGTRVYFSLGKWMHARYNRKEMGGFDIARNGPATGGTGPTESGTHVPYGNTSQGFNCLHLIDTTPGIVEDGDNLYQRAGFGISLPDVPLNTSELTITSNFAMNNEVRVDLMSGAVHNPAHPYDYTFTDISRSYLGRQVSATDADHPKRVDYYVRESLWFRPNSEGVDSDILIICDRIKSLGTQFEKRWYMHYYHHLNGTQYRPVINGTGVVETANQPVRKAGTGKWKYTGSNMYVSHSYDQGTYGNQVYLTPLTPAVDIVIVGGPNASGQQFVEGTPSTGSHEYEDPMGNIGEMGGTVQPWTGRWRTESIPVTPALYDAMLHVVEVGNLGLVRAVPALLTGTNFFGARVRDRIGVFPVQPNYNTGVNPNLEDRLTTGSITIDVAGTYKIVISGLQSSVDYDIDGTTYTSTSAGTIYLVKVIPSSSYALSIALA